MEREEQPDAEHALRRCDVWVGWALTAGLVVCGAVCLLTAFAVPGPWSMALQSNFGHLAFLVATGFAAAGMHELGHLTAAWAVGYRAEEVVVGPWGWRRGDGGMRFFWTQAHIKGHVAALPRPDQIAAPAVWRECVFTAGGPAVSLLLAVPAVAFLLSARPAGGYPAGMVWGLLVWAGFASALMFALCMIPFEDSDARLLHRLLRQPADATRTQAVCILHRWAEDANPLTEWPEAWVRAAISVPDGSQADAIGCFAAFQWACATDRRTEALALLDRLTALEGSEPWVWEPEICLDAAALLAQAGQDLGRARAFYERGMADGTAPELERLWAEAVLLLAEGKPEACRDRIETGMAMVSSVEGPLDPDQQILRAALADLLNEADARRDEVEDGAQR